MNRAASNMVRRAADLVDEILYGADRPTSRSSSRRIGMPIFW